MQYSVLRASDLTNAVLREVLEQGWTINPDGYVVLVRDEPAPQESPEHTDE